MYTISHSYEDDAGKPLKVYLRIVRDKHCHVTKPESADRYHSRDDAKVALDTAKAEGLGHRHYDVEAEPGTKEPKVPGAPKVPRKKKGKAA